MRTLNAVSSSGCQEDGSLDGQVSRSRLKITVQQRSREMPGKHRNRVGWVMESVLIALCLAIFGVLFWIAVG